MRRVSQFLCVALTFPRASHALLLGGNSARHFGPVSRRVVAMATVAPAEVTAETNGLLDQRSLPKFDVIADTDVVPGVSKLLEDFERDVSLLETRAAPTYEVVEDVERLAAPLSYAWGVVSHLNGVKSSDGLREAHAAMQPKVVAANTRLSQSQPVYAALAALEAQLLREDGGEDGSETARKVLGGESDANTKARKRVVEAKVKAMRLGGVGLENEAREKFNANRMRLSELATKFSNNVLDATKAFKLTLTDANDVAGLPDSARALAASRAKATAAAADKEKTAEDGPSSTTQGTAETGPWELGLDAPSYVASMKYLDSQTLREQLYRAFTTRGAPENEAIIAEILTLRAEQARLLGFETFAEVSLESKMAGSVGKVDELHALLAEKAVPAAKRELAEVEAFAQKLSKDPAKTLKHWDVAYYSQKLREERYGYSEEELRPYFALDSVLRGLFGLVEKLFGVQIKPADGAATVWHPDVKFFHVVDDTKVVAAFYLDPYARPENKRGGAWMADCVGKSEALDRDVPVAYLTCNGSPPVDDVPSLMTFSEVETLFHETGHGLQHMLTSVREGDAAGINGVEWDAVELPSQWMENWLYHKPTVLSFARHYDTDETLPDHYFDKILGAKNFQAGMMMARQLAFGALDLQLHQEEKVDIDAFAVQQRIFEQYLPMPPLETDKFLAAFSHIFAGGYAAGYYSYKWAEVMSADAFAAFEEAGLDDDDAIQTVGRRFRDTVLGLGGSVHPADVFRAFRGRDPKPDALLRHSGL